MQDANIRHGRLVADSRGELIVINEAKVRHCLATLRQMHPQDPSAVCDGALVPASSPVCTFEPITVSFDFRGSFGDFQSCVLLSSYFSRHAEASMACGQNIEGNKHQCKTSSDMHSTVTYASKLHSPKY